MYENFNFSDVFNLITFTFENLNFIYLLFTIFIGGGLSFIMALFILIILPKKKGKEDILFALGMVAFGSTLSIYISGQIVFVEENFNNKKEKLERLNSQQEKLGIRHVFIPSSEIKNPVVSIVPFVDQEKIISIKKLLKEAAGDNVIKYYEYILLKQTMNEAIEEATIKMRKTRTKKETKELEKEFINDIEKIKE